MSVNIETTYINNYCIIIEITQRYYKNVYVVSVHEKQSKNLYGYPLQEKIYNINDKKNAFRTYKRYIKKYS